MNPSTSKGHCQKEQQRNSSRLAEKHPEIEEDRRSDSEEISSLVTGIIFLNIAFLGFN